jgi:2-polyprenyl-3-methyl-5-hydroxy-6-metoxy-1,4-benzoquinol methylase
MKKKLEKFSNINYEDFRRFAKDDSMSPYEKIGFPNEYRKGQELKIFEDIKSKLSSLGKKEKIILDIGPGCSDLPKYLIEHCAHQSHSLFMVDSPEMLALLPEESKHFRKTQAYYPNCPDLLKKLCGKVDVILSYSVLHYVIAESNMWNFLDSSLKLLAPGGQMLIGDIPNISKRKRFFSSEAGAAYHKAFMKTDGEPDIQFNRVELNSIDDSVMIGILMRARLAGFDAYIVPQNDFLPMANRREDILIFKP